MRTMPLNVTSAFALFVVFTSHSAFAAELLFDVLSDSSVVEVHIDPQSKQMNVVEGMIEFSGSASDGLSVQIENGQSIFSIWPTPPKYDQDKKTITFVGGVPNGFESKGLLFRLRLSPSVSGEVNIRYVDGSGYLNDGMGTKEFIAAQPLEIHVEKNKARTVKKDPLSPIGAFKYATIIVIVVGFLSIIFYHVYKRNYKQ